MGQDHWSVVGYSYAARSFPRPSHGTGFRSMYFPHIHQLSPGLANKSLTIQHQPRFL